MKVGVSISLSSCTGMEKDGFTTRRNT